MVLGEGLSERDLDRIGFLAASLEDEVRLLDYSQVEEAVERLAALLLEQIPREELKARAFLPIPRGGFVVLGMLSYFLELEPDQLIVAPDDRRRKVLVDDAALSGSRLKQTIGALDDEEIWVAHIASHPDLRLAVTADHRVAGCVAAIDLAALPAPPDRPWGSLEDRAYWTGDPELVVFPWSEPDQVLWDEANQRLESGWRLVSPEKSLKTRAMLGPPSSRRSQRQLRFPERLAIGKFDDGLLLCPLDSEDVYRLDEVAGSIWGALGTLGDVEAAIDHLTREFSIDQSILVADVTSLSEQLIEAGLLERT